MEGKNLNELMKSDPSLEAGSWNLLFERKCSVEMKIIEPSILAMVQEDISNTEELNFKVLSKSKPAPKGPGRFQVQSAAHSERIQDDKLQIQDHRDEPFVGQEAPLLD